MLIQEQDTPYFDCVLFFTSRMVETDMKILKEDLLAKLEALELASEIPDLKLTEYFDLLRNEIDQVCEQLLIEANTSQANNINEKRQEFLNLLNHHQQILIDNASKASIIAENEKSNGSTRQNRIRRIREKIDMFDAIANTDLIEIDSYY